ncbi:psychosine receptor-like [Betta splendens]|uniref:Psychosine receptor-like n=1 Tax=Betta splendens TaxID=158456 RepID=A0A8M1HMX6_BETSP|nr:psychosine receptor-like [Betta splendens]
MNQSDINDTLMDNDDYYINEVYNGTEAAYIYEHYHKILEVLTWLVVAIGLILMPVAIFAVSSLVKKDNVAPIFVINLLVSDIIQLCAMIIVQIKGVNTLIIAAYMYFVSVSASVGFMLCIALERYLLIVRPLWYRTRRTMKMSLLLCAAVWTLPLFYFLFRMVMFSYNQYCLFFIITGIFLLLLVPLLVFFMVGTLRALSASISVRAEEKHRIVGLLVLVLLIYTLLFLPFIIFLLVDCFIYDYELEFVAYFFLKLNPVADLFLYIFLRKGAVNQVWFCCRKNRTSHQLSSGLNDGDTVTSL